MSLRIRNAIGFALVIATLGLIFAVGYEGLRLGDQRQEASRDCD